MVAVSVMRIAGGMIAAAQTRGVVANQNGPHVSLPGTQKITANFYVSKAMG